MRKVGERDYFNLEKREGVCREMMPLRGDDVSEILRQTEEWMRWDGVPSGDTDLLIHAPR